jgi:hypothetical protein
MSPPPALWDKIGEAIGEQKTSSTRIVRMSRVRWAVAATLFLALAGSIYWFSGSRDMPLAEKQHNVSDPLVQQIDPQYARLVTEFTGVIEYKQTELKKLEKDDPELYQKFSGDIQKLDSSYQVLRGTLKANPNAEQLLQAMIENLQLQVSLLNRQLEIIQKVKQTKSQKI